MRRAVIPPGGVTKEGYLALPPKGMKTFAAMAFPDLKERRKFLKSSLSRHPSSEISFDEFSRVHEQVEFLLLTEQLDQDNLFPLARQLEKWEISGKAQEWWSVQAQLVQHASTDSLSLPQGGRAVLAEIAWADDKDAQRDFLKSGLGRRPSGWAPLGEISIEELHRLIERAGELITHQLDLWGILWPRKAGILTTEQIERERRDALFDKFRLQAYISQQETNARARKKGGGHKGGEGTGRKYELTHGYVFLVDIGLRKNNPGLSR